MDHKSTCSPSHTCSGEPLVDGNENAPHLENTKVQGKISKKKKKNKKRQSVACQKQADRECSEVTAEDQSSSQQLENSSAGSNNTQHSQKTKNLCVSPGTSPARSSHQDKIQSTQTEPPQIRSFQTQSSQTPPIHAVHSPSTESIATQTQQSSFTFHQAYWGKSFTDQSANEEETQSSHTSSQMTVICWNIDGLDTDNVSDRVKGLLSNLGRYRADVVLLQEVIPSCLKLLQRVMKDYEFLQGSDEGYFTGILLRKDRVQFLQSNIVNYPTTEMGRNLLIANVSFLGHPLCIMTSHLESCKSGSQERLNQLRRVWKWMKEAPENHTVIFGGDTNLRDWEITKLGGLPGGISDVWEMLGEPEECRYTWDTSINDNNEIPKSIRLRFDRVFLRAAAEGAQLHPETMTLIGLEMLKCDYFISDHWGILCTFSFETS